MLWQVQEALRIERLFEAHAIAAELEAWNLLLPAGDDLRATLVIEAGPGQPHAPARLGGIERHVLARVAGFAPFLAEAGDAGPDAGGEAAVFFLRFAFPPAQVLALRAGATLGLAIDDDRLRVALTLPEPTRLALLADFD